MADFTTVTIFSTSGKNRHFLILKQTVKVQSSLDVLRKINCFIRGEQVIVDFSFFSLVK